MPLDPRRFRKMLAQHGIEVTERDVANMLFDAKAGRDVRGPALNIPDIIVGVMEEPEAKPTCHYLLPKHRAHAPDLPFEVPRRVRMVFDAFDTDKSGLLEADEIIAALRRYGIDATSEGGRALVLGSIGDDNCLDFSEFAVLTAKLEEQARLQRQLRFMSTSLTPHEANDSSPRYLFGGGQVSHIPRPL